MKNWQTVPLDKIATVQQGYTFKPQYQGNNIGKWMYVKVGDLNSHGNTKYINRTLNYVNDDVLQEMNAKPFPAGSIVFSRVGAALKLNKKRILANDSLTDDNVLVITVVEKDKYHPEYLYYWFDSKNLARFCNDGAVPVISGKNLKKEKVFLPPFPEQTAIADLLSIWDAAIEKTEKLIAAKEKRYLWLQNDLITRHSADSDCKKMRLGDILTESRLPDLQNDPKKRITVRLHLKGVAAREHRGTEADGATTFYKRRTGQFIYGKQNIFKGSLGIVPPELDGFSSTQDIPAFDIDESISTDWIYFYFSRPSFYKRLEIYAAGSGSKRLHPKELLKLPIRVPTLLIQNKIAEEIACYKKDLDLLRAILEAYRKQKRGLMQKLLTGQWRIAPTSRHSRENGNPEEAVQ